MIYDYLYKPTVLLVVARYIAAGRSFSSCDVSALVAASDCQQKLHSRPFLP
jgi:hypothetical protein